jgi:hypothetical protein
VGGWVGKRGCVWGRQLVRQEGASAPPADAGSGRAAGRRPPPSAAPRPTCAMRCANSLATLRSLFVSSRWMMPYCCWNASSKRAWRRDGWVGGWVGGWGGRARSRRAPRGAGVGGRSLARPPPPAPTPNPPPPHLVLAPQHAEARPQQPVVAHVAVGRGVGCVCGGGGVRRVQMRAARRSSAHHAPWAPRFPPQRAPGGRTSSPGSSTR